MLRKHRWDELAARILEHVANGTRDLATDTFEMPIANYLDPDRWRREVDVIFRRDPVVLAFASQLVEPDSFLAIERAGVPVLLTRGRDGTLRAFLNKCRHRGALLTGKAEACGSARAFVCPYHAWTFDSSGKLVGLPAQRQFGDIPETYRHLVPLAVEEYAGFIWGVLTPGVEIDLQAFLGDMRPLLEELEIGDFKVIDTVAFDGANWKIAMDGYIENYHFDVLHKNTFSTFLLPSSELLECHGLHQRFIVGHPDIEKLRDIPMSEWQASRYVQLACHVFPNCSFAFVQGEDPDDLSLSFFQIWPGSAPNKSVTYGTLLVSRDLSAAEREARINFFRWSVGVIVEEDYGVGNGIQNGLDTLADETMIFGRMEKLVQNFQKCVNSKVDQT